LIIDGKEAKNKTINDLDVNKIESITVLKDNSATKKYGDKGKYGVILITTKKEK
jgi:TonB-dependent SusC/RagA subfamily outer membrane receptor